MKLVKDIEKKALKKQVTDKEAEEAFVKILQWLGEDPGREGLLETPKRVVKAFKEYFKGYKEDPKEILNKTFGDVNGYDDMVVQKNISVQSHCEHHLAPIIGFAHVAYIPKDSTAQQLINMIHQIKLAMTSNKIAHGVFLDVSAAFDAVHNVYIVQ